MQAHLVVNPLIDPELVEGGQLLAMYIDPKIGGGSKRDPEDDEDDEDKE